MEQYWEPTHTYVYMCIANLCGKSCAYCTSNKKQTLGFMIVNDSGHWIHSPVYLTIFTDQENVLQQGEN